MQSLSTVLVKESNPEPHSLWYTGKWQTRASVVDGPNWRKRTKPNITSQFHSFGLTGVHREVCSTKAKQRWWMVPFILSFNCSPLTGSGSLHFPRHNCWLLNWLVTWVFTFAEPRSLYYQMTPTTTTSSGGRLHNNIKTNGRTRFCTKVQVPSGVLLA